MFFQHLPDQKNRKNTSLETVSRFITSVSFGKRVLIWFTVAWKHCIRFPWILGISRKTCHQAFFVSELGLVLHFPFVPVFTVVKLASYVIVRLPDPGRVASQCSLPNSMLNVSMIGCRTLNIYLILWVDQNPVELDPFGLATCGGVEFCRSAIPTWIFTVDKWMRGQQVWARRRGRQQHRRGRWERTCAGCSVYCEAQSETWTRGWMTYFGVATQIWAFQLLEPCTHVICAVWSVQLTVHVKNVACGRCICLHSPRRLQGYSLSGKRKSISEQKKNTTVQSRMRIAKNSNFSVRGSSWKLYSSSPSNCCFLRCYVRCIGWVGVFPPEVSFTCSSCSLFNSRFASTKSGRWFSGPWTPSSFNEMTQFFSLRVLSSLVAKKEWSSNSRSSYWIICSSVHLISDIDLLYLSSLCHLSKKRFVPTMFGLASFLQQFFGFVVHSLPPRKLHFWHHGWGSSWWRNWELMWRHSSSCPTFWCFAKVLDIFHMNNIQCQFPNIKHNRGWINFLTFLLRFVSCLLDSRVRVSSDVAAAGFPITSRCSLGGLRIFLLLDQVDPVVHFANSDLVQTRGTLGVKRTFWYSSSLVFMHTASSM